MLRFFSTPKREGLPWDGKDGLDCSGLGPVELLEPG
jgi:hypothetical protein